MTEKLLLSICCFALLVSWATAQEQTLTEVTSGKTVKVAAEGTSVAPSTSPAPVVKKSMKRKSGRKSSGYSRWKRTLPFWWRKAFLLAELSLTITIGVLLAQMLEVSGWIRIFAVVAYPITWLGRLGTAASAPLLVAFRSGAAANSMLASSHAQGSINKRQLYSSVLVVSCISLFSHLPSYVIPIGAVLGREATFAFFTVRFATIFTEIFAILLVSGLVLAPFTDRRAKKMAGNETTPLVKKPEKKDGEKKKTFWKTVWKRSSRTLRRLMIYLVPTYCLMVGLEYYGVFQSLTEMAPWLCNFSFLPPESAMIIPAQAVSLYSGAAIAASYVDQGDIIAKQAVVTLLIGSVVTAPIRTLKRILPTYVATLGPKAGPVMAVTAQVLRSLFLIVFIIILWFAWK